MAEIYDFLHDSCGPTDGLAYISPYILRLRPPRGVCGACLNQVHKPCVIGAFPSQTYGKETTIIHYHRFVMELLQWHKVCEIGGEELHRPPVVALKPEKIAFFDDHTSRVKSSQLLMRSNR